jgi:hypothetical protein
MIAHARQGKSNAAVFHFPTFCRENTKLKTHFADAILDNAALKELLSRNW